MSHEAANRSPHVPTPRAQAADNVVLSSLASASEDCEGQHQHLHLSAALEALAPIYPALFPNGMAMIERATAFARVGAAESAVLALIPPDATFTGARLGDASAIAQVVLAPEIGAHSRGGTVIAMAWLAALLRAVEKLAASPEGARP